MNRLLEKAKQMLEKNIIPFWKNLRDDYYGGYIGHVDFSMQPDIKAEKGCILHSRILWFFSESALLLNRMDLAADAEHVYSFFTQHCLDREYGGVYWSVSFDGTPVDTTKHTYNQAFALYALSSYYRLTKNPNAKKLAYELFDLIQTKAYDGAGYLEAFDRNWNPASNEKLSENGVMAGRTMNTLLHVFEAYSGFYRATKDERVGDAMRQILQIYQEKIFNPEKRRQEVFFDMDYHSLIDLHSYGHDIESSWLIDDGCSLLQDETLNTAVFAIDDILAENIYEIAYQNHSVLNECENGKPDENRIWWVQAESVLGFYHMYEKHGDCRYLQAAHDVFDYIEQHFLVSGQPSEWFWALDKNGVPIQNMDIVNGWKCPYHNGRMCLELIRRNLYDTETV
ncbi:MAG: AGE family epimerase/isomerase [Oscillospiraceae bacterium]|nr:AGE family epimerase/isomerase [Oscillospiraceae bacterium]MDD7294313.1 AGE family epimerase/isomerase [Oscillospiraceae bacterium]